MLELTISLGDMDVEGETREECVAKAVQLYMSLIHRSLRGEDELEVYILGDGSTENESVMYCEVADCISCGHAIHIPGQCRATLDQNGANIPCECN